MLLSLNPDTMKPLREEHDQVFGTDLETTLDLLESTPTKLNELHYTSAVVKETLRIFPVGFSPREAPEGQYGALTLYTYFCQADKLRDTLEYQGVSYPIKDQFIISVQHITHFNPEYFPDPTRFLPDRFLESYEPKAHRYAWRPFERGPRACMGQELAMDELRILLLLTARWIDFETVLPELPKTTDVTFSDLELRIGELAYQEIRMSAAPRTSLRMRLRRTGRQ